MSMTNPVPTSAGSGGHVPPVPERAVIDGDKILFAGKRFHLKVGNQVETSPALLLMVQRFLNEGGQLQQVSKLIKENTGAKVASVQVPATTFRCPINLQTGDITVIRNSGKDHVRLGVIQGEMVKASELRGMREQVENRGEFSHALRRELDKYTPKTIQEAVSQIRNEGHIRLGALVDPEFNYSDEWREKTLGDKLHMQGNEGLHAALDDLSRIQRTSGNKTGVESCRKGIVLFILQNMQKNPLLIHSKEGDAIQRVFKDQIPGVIAPGYVVKADSFTANRAYPSESDRKSARAKYGDLLVDQSMHPSNLRVVDVCDASGKVVQKVFGSGRADSAERLKRVVLFALTQQLQVEGTPGLRKDGEGGLEFRHVISSYKDFSRLKKMFVEDERSLIENLLHAAAEWPADGFRVKVEIDGVLQDVTLKKPIIANQPFSQFAKYSTLGQEHSDRCNFISNQQFLNDLLQGGASDTLRKSAEVLDEKLQEVLGEKGSYINRETGLIDWDRVPFDTLLKSVKWYTIGDGDFFGSKEIKSYLKATAEALFDKIANGDAKEKEAAKCLYALTFRRHPPAVLPTEMSWRPSAHEALHAMDLEIYRTNLCTNLGLSRGMQCKSGSDRTAIGTAIASSLHRFQMMTGRTFMPTDMSLKVLEGGAYDDLMLFKGLIREALVHHGAAYAVQTKGYSGLKMAWGKGIGENPVPLKYLYLEEDLPAIAGMGPDVVGLTYDDLRAGGSEQYKGTLASRGLLYGKSETAGIAKKGVVQSYLMDHVRSAQANINKDDVAAVNKALHKILAKLKVTLLPTDEIVSKKLELLVYAGKLGLERHFQKNKDGFLEFPEMRKLLQSMAKGDAMGLIEQERLPYLTYALQSLYNIGEERALNASLARVEAAGSSPKAAQALRSGLPISTPLSNQAIGNGLMSLVEAESALPKPQPIGRAASSPGKRRVSRTLGAAAQHARKATRLTPILESAQRDINAALDIIEKGKTDYWKPLFKSGFQLTDELFAALNERLDTFRKETGSTAALNEIKRKNILGFCRAWAEENQGNALWEHGVKTLEKIALRYPDARAVKGVVASGNQEAVYGLHFYLFCQAKNPATFLETIHDHTALDVLDLQITSLNSKGTIDDERYAALQTALLNRGTSI